MIINICPGEEQQAEDTDGIKRFDHHRLFINIGAQVDRAVWAGSIILQTHSFPNGMCLLPPNRLWSVVGPAIAAYDSGSVSPLSSGLHQTGRRFAIRFILIGCRKFDGATKWNEDFPRFADLFQCLSTSRTIGFGPHGEPQHQHQTQGC